MNTISACRPSRPRWTTYSVCTAPPAGYQRRRYTEYNLQPGYTAAEVHLRNLVQNEEVYQDGASLVSRTEYEHDTAGLQSYGGTLPGYDATVSGYRGNITRVRNYLDAGRGVIQERRYDVFGNLVTAIDGRGYSTSITYGASYNYAFPTLVTRPTSVENPVQLTTETAYDLSLGQRGRGRHPYGGTLRRAGVGGGEADL